MSTSLQARLVDDFTDEAAAVRRYLERVPEDRLDWKPHAKSMTLGQLAGHLAEAPGWVLGMEPDEFDMAALEEQGYAPFVPGSREELLATLEENARVFRRVVGGMSEETLAAEWTMRAGDAVLLRAPRHVAIRRTGIHHWIHHRGQLSVYLRELGVDLPSVYGPTADDPTFA